MRDTYNWRGYRNALRMFGAAGIAVLVAVVAILAVPGLRYAEAAGTGAVAVALIVTFGLRYALDASPRRVELYGRSRESAAAGSVLGFFFIAVTTLGSLVAYLLWPPGHEVSLAFCWLGKAVCGALPRAVDLGPWFAGYGVVGLATTLAGSAQLFIVMYNPPLPDPQSTTVEVVSRLGARAIDAAFLIGVVLAALTRFGSVRLRTPEGWVLIGGLALGAFLYEAVPLIWTRVRTLGKLVWRLDVVDARSGETVSKACAFGRALVTSLVYSLAPVALLLLSLGQDLDRTFGWQIAAGVVLILSPLMHVRGQGLHDAAFGTKVVRYRKGESRKVPTDPGETGSSPTEFRLRPPDPDDGTDLLDRRTQVELVCGLLRSEAGPAVVTVNAPWGGGKTTFLRMCADELRGSDGVLVVEFNSWTQQYTKNPLVDLVGAISHQLTTGDKSGSDSNLRDQAEPLAEVFGSARTNRPLFTSWESTHESVEAFCTALREVAAGQGGRVLLVVDELDRCQPSYALGILEALHHLFAVKGVVAVVGVSRDELCNSIWSLYGERFDADTYLRRFTDLPIDLPPPTYENLSRFMGKQLQTSGLTGRIQTRSATILQLVAQIEGCSLRDLQQATHRAALALLSEPPEAHPRIIWEQSVMAMIVLRVADQAAYRQFARREIDSSAALAAVNARLQPLPAGIDPTQAISRTWFEAALLNVEPAGFSDSAGFKQRYSDAHHQAGFDLDSDEPFAGTDPGADRTLDALSRLRRDYSSEYAGPHGWRPLWVESITDRLDLLAE